MWLYTDLDLNEKGNGEFHNVYRSNFLTTTVMYHCFNLLYFEDESRVYIRWINFETNFAFKGRITLFLNVHYDHYNH